MTTRSRPVNGGVISDGVDKVKRKGRRLTDTTTGVRGSTEVKRIDITLHASRLNPALLHPLNQELRIMDSLRARQDLFTSHEEIVRVGQGRVGRVGHRVEWSNRERELVEDVIVGAVLFLDESAEPSFVFGAAGGLAGRSAFGERRLTSNRRSRSARIHRGSWPQHPSTS